MVLIAPERCLATAASARAQADYVAAVGVLREHIPSMTGETQAHALNELAALELLLGRYADADATLDAVVTAARALGDPSALALALARTAALRSVQWRFDETADACREAEALEVTGLPRVEVLVACSEAEHDQGRYAQAAAFADQACVEAAALPAGTESDQARSLATSVQAAVLRSEGSFTAAEGLLLEALELAERGFGPDALETGGVLNGLGMTYKFCGRFADAEPLYLRAVAILEQASAGELHPDLANLEHNLGGLSHAAGDYAKAEPHARRSVEIRRATRGDHPLVAMDEAALAPILGELGRTEEAKDLLRSAIATMEATFGLEHHELAVALNNLASLLSREGDLTAAEEMYRRALRTKRALLDPAAPEIGFTLNNLALVRRKLGDDQGAADLYGEALALLTGGLEPTHPSIARCARNYAKALRALGQDDAAHQIENTHATKGTSPQPGGTS